MNSKRFAVKCGNGFYKRSYDTFGGHWTHDQSSAQTWATAAGAQRMADKQQQYARQFRTNDPDSIRVVSVE